MKVGAEAERELEQVIGGRRDPVAVIYPREDGPIESSRGVVVRSTGSPVLFPREPGGWGSCEQCGQIDGSRSSRRLRGGGHVGHL
jgi:hypothetical protein